MLPTLDSLFARPPSGRGGCFPIVIPQSLVDRIFQLQLNFLRPVSYSLTGSMYQFLTLMVIRQKMRKQRIRCPQCGHEHFYHGKRPLTYVYCRDCGTKIDLRKMGNEE